jgi:hypothetical protein
MGTVTGIVICGDTQLPARFAKVSLIRKPSKEERDAIFAPPDSRPDGAAKNTGRKLKTFDIIQKHAGLDGGYVVEKVPPGDYWVVAQRDGYIFPIMPAANEKEERDLDRLMAAAVTVHVDAERTAKADVTLERGAVIAGKVAFDDGSTAVGWDVWLVSSASTALVPVDNPYTGVAEAIDDTRLGVTSTDDGGNFHMAGIPPGKYIVVTQLTINNEERLEDASSILTGGGAQVLTAYGPGVFTRESARQIEIHGTETVGDADLKLDLSRLRSIRGRVLRKEDGQPVHGSIVYVHNGSIAQRARVEADGSYHLDYLPSGTYVLDLTPAFPDPADRTRHYQRPPPQNVVVGEEDVTLDDLLLVERKKAEASHPPDRSDAPK